MALLANNSIVNTENNAKINSSMSANGKFPYKAEFPRNGDLETVELLRQRLLEWAFENTSREKIVHNKEDTPFRLGLLFYFLCIRSHRKSECAQKKLVVRLYQKNKRYNAHRFFLHKGSQHGDQKLKRYNHLCPWHHVTTYIKEQHMDLKGSMPLCIENCSQCPDKKYHFENNSEWTRVCHKDVDKANTILNNFVSQEVIRGKMSVIKDTSLALEFSLTGGKISCSKKWTVKVLKKLWFEKIRTSTPAKRGGSQPLNLTYEKFWVEVIPDEVYLKITGINTERQNQRIPIDSVIGATVDSTMQICLALQSSFRKSKNKRGELKGVEFGLFVRQELVRFNHQLRVGLSIKKNVNSFESPSQLLHSNTLQQGCEFDLQNLPALKFNFSDSSDISNSNSNPGDSKPGQSGVLNIFSFDMTCFGLDNFKSALQAHIAPVGTQVCKNISNLFFLQKKWIHLKKFSMAVTQRIHTFNKGYNVFFILDQKEQRKGKERGATPLFF
ncbi:hypothetical protein RFI_12174 [Reticulomyxa filosa]|uniref:Uncharacterized protein n=1 Tax=Reticulomyxa filosa TaxID=46433 RepID=X6NGY1_RETFI|nr:hypothetical protein RFI_12174 [Reticulomyxa filosa]|eukprot:ETO24969.1 hypothetical protein RFI_12174 [Reticulomyxa filosa]